MSQCNNDIYTGINKDTSKYLQLNSGVFVKDFVVGDLESGAYKDKIIGATQGGTTVSIVPIVRDTQADGSLGKWKGGTRFDAWDVMMSAAFMEVDLEVLETALAAVETTTTTFYEELDGLNVLCEDKYIGNITFIGKINGSAKPLMVQIFNVVNTSGFVLNSTDGAEGTVSCDLTGHYDPADLTTPPFKIFVPKNIGTVSGVISNSGGTVEGATVTVVLDSGNPEEETYTAVTNSAGVYTLALPYGTGYTVNASKDAETGTQAAVDVVAGAETANVDITIA